MPELDEQTVRHVADLARLDLDEDEVARYADDLATILGHFEELEGMDLPTDAGPHGRGLEPADRADAPNPDPLAFSPDRMAPDWRSDLFVVPRLPALGEEEGGGP